MGTMEKTISLIPTTKKGWAARGLRDGIPVCMGYFAVSFALGIAAREAGIRPLQSFFMSAGMMASAGEFAAISLIAASAGVLEMIATTVVVNLRYFLMSCSLSQKLRPDMPFIHRFFLAQCLTDEIFGLSMAVEGLLEPVYTYCVMAVSELGWCSGTVLGVVVGNILPERISSALSVALYGMFLAIIIPPAKKNRFIAVIVAVSMAASGLFSVIPGIRGIGPGFRVIILTLGIACAAAVIRPVDEDPGAGSAGTEAAVPAPAKEEK